MSSYGPFILPPVGQRTRRLGAAALLALGALALAVPTATAQQAQTQPQLPQQPGAQQGLPSDARTQTHGDWTTVCRDNAQGGENCIMVQGVTSNQSGERVMEVIVGRLRSSGQLGMVITLPLAISLPPGATVGIDQAQPETYAFQRCLPTGCQIEMLLDETLIERMKRGSRGGVAFRDLSGQSITIPFSLTGFTAAFNVVAGQ